VERHAANQKSPSYSHGLRSAATLPARVNEKQPQSLNRLGWGFFRGGAVSLELLWQAYSRTPIGEDAWVLPNGKYPLQAFQAVVAAAEAWEVMRYIEIVEIHEENHTGRRLIDAVRFRRLK
jgi:hypothetical protein